MELHIVNPKKYRSLKIYIPKNTSHQNFLPKEIWLKYLNTDLFKQMHGFASIS